MSGKRFLEVISGFYIAVIHTNRIIDTELDGIGSSTGLRLTLTEAEKREYRTRRFKRLIAESPYSSVQKYL
ncbi:MAG: hypothetical protein HYU56_05390 [Candidatus Aenigmarchaeota archaeon]|nr:hypothetical protein [Candidatus Aenigmarchaeota archaeon]